MSYEELARTFCAVNYISNTVFLDDDDDLEKVYLFVL